MFYQLLAVELLFHAIRCIVIFCITIAIFPRLRNIFLSSKTCGAREGFQTRYVLCFASLTRDKKCKKQCSILQNKCFILRGPIFFEFQSKRLQFDSRRLQSESLGIELRSKRIVRRSKRVHVDSKRIELTILKIEFDSF
jgi:hypothetical protein